MHFSTIVIVAAVAVSETLASPTHAHLHRHANAHAKKENVEWKDLDWASMGIDWTSAWAAGQKTAEPVTTSVPTTTTVAVEAKPTVAPIIAIEKVKSSSTLAVVPSSTSAAPAASSSASKSSSGASTAFSKVQGLANKLALTAFGSSTSSSGNEVSYIGNIGSPQGSNMLLVDSVGSHKYTNTFENTAGSPITIMVWNKAYTMSGDAKDAQANLGASMAPKSPALSITLAAGESQVVAFAENTQISWAEATTDIAASGAFATTWGEMNFVSTGCGYDVSAIMNKKCNTYDMTISSKEVTCVSSMTQNLWIGNNCNPELPIPIGTSDGSCYIPAGTCTVTTKMGGSTV